MTKKSKDSLEREGASQKSDKQQLKEVSKRIKKCTRIKKRAKRKEMIQQMLEQFRGAKNISQIKSARKKTLITKKKNAKGKSVTSRKGIANVFYSKLYAEEEGDNDEEYDHCRADKNISSRGQKSDDNKVKFQSSQKMRCRLPSTASKKAKRVTTTEYALKTSMRAAKRRKK